MPETSDPESLSDEQRSELRRMIEEHGAEATLEAMADEIEEWDSPDPDKWQQQTAVIRVTAGLLRRSCPT